MSQIALKIPCSCAAASRQGGRDENQDSYGACDTAYGSLLLVCDGMGGGPGGRTASTLAVQAIQYAMTELKHEGQTRAEILRFAISYANQVLLNKQVENPELRGMGTTCTALLIDEYSAIVAHVGDSRVYRIRNKQKSFRTKDHSKVGEMVCRGLLTEEQARLSAESNIITKALGRADIFEPEMEEIGYEKGDRFVLCTDGIWGMIPEPELTKKCSEKKNIDALVESITIFIDTLGFSQGGRHDNLTIAILEPSKDSKYKEPMNKKAKRIIYALAVVCVLSILFNCFQQLKSSRWDRYKETITLMEDSCKNLKEENRKLNDSITKVKEQAEQSIKDVKDGGAQYAQAMQEIMDEQNAQIKKLEKENGELQKENEDLRKKQQAANKPQNTANNNSSLLSSLKSKLEDLKGCTGKNVGECAHNVTKKKDNIVKYINDNLKKTNSDKEKKQLKKIKEQLSKESFDTQVIVRSGKVQLSDIAKKQIEEIIKDIK